MKIRFTLPCFIFGALLFLAPRAFAETNAACCRCSSFYKLSDEGFGFMRHHVGFCPKCKGEMGGDVDAYLARLRGRVSGLNDAARLTLTQIHAATAARDKARDAIYGRKGLAVDFFKSLMSFAAEGASGTVKTVAQNVKKGLDWYNRAADTAQGNFQWVIKEGKKWVYNKPADEAKTVAMRKAAAAMGQSYMNRTGDARGATKQFLEAHGDIKKGVSILESGIDYYEKTDKLANGIQEYLEQRANAERLWKEWNDITDQMEPLLKEIEKLQRCRDEMQKQGKTGFWRRPADSALPRTARLRGTLLRGGCANPSADERAALKALVFPPNSPNAATLESMKGTLLQLRTQLATFNRALEEDVIPPLLPFWLEVQNEFGRDLGKALLEWANKPTEDVSRQFDRLVRFGEGVTADLRRTGATLD